MSENDSLSLPRALDDDTDDVRWALETAGTLWTQGDQRSALRWLSRAAETAAHEENDRRSLVLARAAADLRGRLNLASSLVPSADKPPPPKRTQIGLPVDETPKQAEGVVESTTRPSETPPDSERRARHGASHVAVRVAVGGGLNNEGGLRVRRLADGEVTRDGEHLAMLVSLESDVDLSLL